MARSAKANLRHPPKVSKPGKSLRPSTGVLQNAIVLAPFHTLKRCFQNKLVDLYSHEKIKKTNRKIKMAEKKKMSFEYDIVELNKLDPRIKKEGKGPKQRQKLRSPSYCQCNRDVTTDDKKASNSFRKKDSRCLFNPQASNFLGHLETKRRKINSPALTPDTLKTELSPRMGFCSPNTSLPSDMNLSASRVSSRSKSDTSETYSNSPSCRDERLTGSLAISTTSFDSCLDHFDRADSDCPSTTRRATKRTKAPRSAESDNPNCLSKPTADLSRHMIMHGGTKNSDGRIVDFLDREPQTRVISVESTRRLQPLPRRRSKTRAKKPESATGTTYYLRSLTPGVEVPPLAEVGSCSSRGSAPNQNRILQVEVATQVEETTQECAACVSDVLGDSTSSGILLRPETPPEPPSDEKPESQEDTETCEPLCEMMTGRTTSSMETPPKEVEMSSGLCLPERPGDRDSFEVVPDLGERFQEPNALGRAQDKESSFIFGPRNTASRLGESCKFSFGLNFVFSDDED